MSQIVRPPIMERSAIYENTRRNASCKLRSMGSVSQSMASIGNKRTISNYYRSSNITDILGQNSFVFPKQIDNLNVNTNLQNFRHATL